MISQSEHSHGISWSLPVCRVFCSIIACILIDELKYISKANTINNNWAATRDFQKCGILTSVDSVEPVQPPSKLRNSKLCSISSLTLVEYWSDWQSLRSDCACAQADLRLCWSHIPHCWKSHVAAQICFSSRNMSKTEGLVSLSKYFVLLYTK